LNCGMCGTTMAEHESNNPLPFVLDDIDDRVCRDCDDFVSATRLLCRTEEQVEFVQNLLIMALLLKKARKESKKAFEELNKQTEE